MLTRKAVFVCAVLLASLAALLLVRDADSPSVLGAETSDRVADYNLPLVSPSEDDMAVGREAYLSPQGVLDDSIEVPEGSQELDSLAGKDHLDTSEEQYFREKYSHVVTSKQAKALREEVDKEMMVMYEDIMRRGLADGEGEMMPEGVGPTYTAELRADRSVLQASIWNDETWRMHAFKIKKVDAPDLFLLRDEMEWLDLKAQQLLYAERRKQDSNE